MTNEQTPPEENEAAVGPSALNAGLGAFVCEKWVVWYDGTGGYTPGYCRSDGVLLFDSEHQAKQHINFVVLSSLKAGYRAKKVLMHEAPNVEVSRK